MVELTAELLISVSKLVAPPLDEVVRHGGVRGGCRSSQRFVARHALRSRTHHVHFKSAARFLIHEESQNTVTATIHNTKQMLAFFGNTRMNLVTQLSAWTSGATSERTTVPFACYWMTDWWMEEGGSAGHGLGGGRRTLPVVGLPHALCACCIVQCFVYFFLAQLTYFCLQYRSANKKTVSIETKTALKAGFVTYINKNFPMSLRAKQSFLKSGFLTH